MILPLRIALKFHQNCKRNVFVSLLSLISMISIAIGIAIAIITLSVINGFEYELNKRILSIIPHGEIISTDTTFTDWETILEKIRHIPNIIYVNPYINFSGVVEFNNKWHALYIKSINLIKNNNTYETNNRLTDFIEKQSWKNFCEHKNQIILGNGLSNILNTKIGDWITVLITKNFTSKHKLLFSPDKIQLQVSGTLNLHSQLDENIAIISLSDARNYCNNRLDVDGIEIIVKNVFDINQTIKQIKKILHTNTILIRSWIDNYGNIYQDIQVVRLIIYLSVILILGISCFNVIATLLLSIKNKYYDIAILKAIGASNILIQHIFLWYGLIIYCISSTVGFGLGIFITINLINIDFSSIKIFGNKIFPKSMYFIDFIPIYFNRWNFIYILGIVLSLGLLISWYTSFRIKKNNLFQKLK